MSPPTCDKRPRRTSQRAWGALILGIGAGYATLAGLFFALG